MTRQTRHFSTRTHKQRSAANTARGGNPRVSSSGRSTLLHPHDRHYPGHSPSSRSHYDPSQPRVPRSHPDGGQWTSCGYGLLSDLGDATSEVAMTASRGPARPSRNIHFGRCRYKSSLRKTPRIGGLIKARRSGVARPACRNAMARQEDRVFGQGEPLEAGRSGGGDSLSPSLPFRRFFRRSPTAGVLRTLKGDFEIVSGTGGRRRLFPKVLLLLDDVRFMPAPVAYKIKEGITEATYLN